MAHPPPTYYLHPPRRGRGRGQVGLAPTIIPGSIMKKKLASDIPFDGEIVVVDEDDYAATRTDEAFVSALDIIEGQALLAKSDTERAAIDEVLFSIEAAHTVRQVAADSSKLAQLEVQAAKGDLNAKSVVIAVNVSKVADMKAAAQEVADGLKAGHAAAVRTSQAIARAAASPGEKQGYAKAMVGLIEECVGGACEAP